MHSLDYEKEVSTILLKVLKDHGKMYEYEITQRVRKLSTDLSCSLKASSPLPFTNSKPRTTQS
jgi:DNA-binding PadR family transcriptional regulator